MKTIIFNGREYGINEEAVIDSLFNRDGTLDGTYKKYKNRIELTANNGSTIAIGREKGIYKDASSVIISSKGNNGYYMHSTSSIDDKLFNIPSGLMEKLDNANTLLKQFNL